MHDAHTHTHTHTTKQTGTVTHSAGLSSETARTVRPQAAEERVQAAAGAQEDAETARDAAGAASAAQDERLRRQLSNSTRPEGADAQMLKQHRPTAKTRPANAGQGGCQATRIAKGAWSRRQPDAAPSRSGQQVQPVAQRKQLGLHDWDSLMSETAGGLRRAAASGPRTKAAQRKQPTPRSFAQATRGGGP